MIASHSIAQACAAMAFCLALTAPTLAQAASETIVYAFPAARDGAGPRNSLIHLGGRLYGTTSGGGKYAAGTLFSVTRAGGHRIEHAFHGGADGSTPGALLLDVGGTLYGVTGTGGAACNCGTVFSRAPDGTYKQLYQFKGGSDGGQPRRGLAMLGGVIYGTTYAGGGTCNCGTVFSITPEGAENIVHAFQGGSDGAVPNGVISDGTMLYGTTTEGGNTGCYNGCGTVYSLTPSGTETILHVFDKPANGIVPAGGLLLEGNVLYGTTIFSGADACGQSGCGTVFRLSLTGGFRILHNFDLADGNQPMAGLIDVHGMFYGTTYAGGPRNNGVVFGMTRDGTVTVLHSFGNKSDGFWPTGDLIDVGGVLYGTTDNGGGTKNKACGRLGCGTVFAVTP